MVSSELILLTGISAFLAIGIGANDETFAPIVGSKRLTINQSVLLGGGVVTLGAVILGINVAKTVGTGIVDQDALTFSELQIVVVLFAVATSLILGSWKGLPLSTTHAMVGSTLGMAMVLTGDLDVIEVNVVVRILLSWIISPTLGLIGSYYVMKGINEIRRRYIKGLDDVDRLEDIFSQLLLISVVVTAFSRGANDVSNAVAPLLPLYIGLAESVGNSLLIRVPLLLGGIFMAFGLILIGRNVLKTVGNDLVELSPTTALGVQLSTALITLTAASIGIPISGTHVLVSSFVGVGIASKSNVNMRTVRRIALSAVGTPFFAALVTFIYWQISLLIF